MQPTTPHHIATFPSNRSGVNMLRSGIPVFVALILTACETDTDRSFQDGLSAEIDTASDTADTGGAALDAAGLNQVVGDLGDTVLVPTNDTDYDTGYDTGVLDVAPPPSVTCGSGAIGYYCGSETNISGGSANTLYYCGTKYAAPTSSTVCSLECLVMPSGTNDACAVVYKADSTTRSVGASPNTDSSGRLKWDVSGAKLGGKSLPSAAKVAKVSISSGGTTYDITSTSSAGLQCAGWAQAITGIGSTSLWHKGPKVISSCPATGTVVATFNSSGSYSGHAGMVVSCSASSLKLIDTNYVGSYQVGVHSLSSTGTGSVSDAGAYYTVYAP